MTNFLLAEVSSLVASYGRGVVFYAPKWDTLSALSMAQLGVTEGDIVITPNATTAGLTIPELTGPAKHEMDYTGEAPTVAIPLYLADPALFAICSPSGSAHAGRSRRGAVKEWTIAVIPEALFLGTDPDSGIVTDYTVAFDGAGVWKFNGVVLTPAQQDLLDVSFWMWRSVFTRPPRKFRGGDGDAKKNIETVTLESMHHPLLPEGHHIYTTGDPFASNIDLNGMS